MKCGSITIRWWLNRLLSEEVHNDDLLIAVSGSFLPSFVGKNWMTWNSVNAWFAFKRHQHQRPVVWVNSPRCILPHFWLIIRFQGEIHCLFWIKRRESLPKSLFNYLGVRRNGTRTVIGPWICRFSVVHFLARFFNRLCK